MSLPPRRVIPYPDPHYVDDAPQLLIVALADSALLAVERALDSAHPVLAATKVADGQSPPLLLSTERIAIQVCETSAQLAALLREYLDSVRFDLEDFDGDLVDPF
jgi:hypothetical protein